MHSDFIEYLIDSQRDRFVAFLRSGGSGKGIQLWSVLHISMVILPTFHPPEIWNVKSNSLSNDTHHAYVWMILQMPLLKTAIWTMRVYTPTTFPFRNSDNAKLCESVKSCNPAVADLLEIQNQKKNSLESCSVNIFLNHTIFKCVSSLPLSV